VMLHRHSLNDRRDDLYETPACATEALIRAEMLPPLIWEPACGRGAIVRVLRAAGYHVRASDLVDYGCPEAKAGIDFLMWRGCEADITEAIITNPPFKLAHKFVSHALELCPLVIMLLRLSFLESVRRTDILDGAGLARVHVFKNRLPMMHRDGWQGPRASSAVAHAWFVWHRGYKGPTELHRISWE
jgi:hypothetical protein